MSPHGLDHNYHLQEVDFFKCFNEVDSDSLNYCNREPSKLICNM